MNMKVDLCGVTLNNPVMTASGTTERTPRKNAVYPEITSA